MNLFCSHCRAFVDARLTDGREVSPDNFELRNKPYWIHDECGNSVECKPNAITTFNPIGCITTPQLKRSIKKLEIILSRIAVECGLTTKELNKQIGRSFGRRFYPHDTRNIHEVKLAFLIAKEIRGRYLHEQYCKQLQTRAS